MEEAALETQAPVQEHEIPTPVPEQAEKNLLEGDCGMGAGLSMSEVAEIAPGRRDQWIPQQEDSQVSQCVETQPPVAKNIFAEPLVIPQTAEPKPVVRTLV
ncbi:unnamed protein product, partial [Symbiodinium pilosum]